MKVVYNALSRISSNLISITRNTENGWYEFEIGIPATWAFKNTSEITCEILTENPVGKILRISPVVDTILIDDLIDFVSLIIETNQKIVEKENAFYKTIEDIKQMVDEKLSSHKKELEILKESSFVDLTKAAEAKPVETSEPLKAKRGRPAGTTKS